MSGFERIGGTDECPVTKDQYMYVPCGETMLRLSQAHDYLVVFPEGYRQYNYLHYWDSESGNMRIIYCSQEGMDYLHDLGLRHVQADSITETELSIWCALQGNQVEEEMMDEGL